MHLKNGRNMSNSEKLRHLFMPYIVMYGPNEAMTGIKGIRSDAPKEAIDSFLLWYRGQHRYDNGRMMNKNDLRLKKLIIKVTEDKDEQEDVGDGEPTLHHIHRCCSIA